MQSHRHKGTFVCNYLSFHDPHLNITFRLPLVHIKMKNGEVQFRTDALVDSGATTTFVPRELIDILGVELPDERQDAVGAGSVFPTCKIRLDLIEVFKNTRAFCALENINVTVPIMEGAIPHTILGRDSMFWLHDITFRERKQHTIFREPKKS